MNLNSAHDTARSAWRQRVANVALALIAVLWGMPAGAQLALDGLLGAQAGDFLAVDRPRQFTFPADHGAHPGFRTEWWYATGVLETEDKARVGFQLTLFRYGLKGRAGERPAAAPVSAWQAESVWMGHMAVSDPERATFRSAEVFARGARIGAAGATVSPTRVWLNNWRFAHDDKDGWRLEARHDDLAIQLDVSAVKPLVLQGDAGYSRKSAEPGRASYYYAYTRLEGTGRVTMAGREHAGRVRVWLDREWSSASLADNQVGWDWFGVHLDDGRDLMVYRLRRRDGSVEPFSAGAVVAADGQRTGLSIEDFEMEPVRRATMASGRTYPVAWRVRIPRAGLDLRVESVFDEQEHTGTVAYWEGLVDVKDDTGRKLGQGYLEMTGY